MRQHDYSPHFNVGCQSISHLGEGCDRKYRKGSALLLVIIILGIFMVLGVILSKIAYNVSLSSHLLLEREQAFWLAEAGLEKGKAELKRDPDWYTDLPHNPENDIDWLKSAAAGSRTEANGGWIKIVRESSGSSLYSVGFKGRAAVILKVKNLIWEEL